MLTFTLTELSHAQCTPALGRTSLQLLTFLLLDEEGGDELEVVEPELLHATTAMTSDEAPTSTRISIRAA